MMMIPSDSCSHALVFCRISLTLCCHGLSVRHLLSFTRTTRYHVSATSTCARSSSLSKTSTTNSHRFSMISQSWRQVVCVYLEIQRQYLILWICVPQVHHVRRKRNTIHMDKRNNNIKMTDNLHVPYST